jgi:excisionase family DNA binding protein
MAAASAGLRRLRDVATGQAGWHELSQRPVSPQGRRTEGAGMKAMLDPSREARNGVAQPVTQLTAARVLTVEHVAELLEMTPRWVRAAAREGRIPARKLGKYWRFDAEEVLHWWEGGCVDGD